MAKKDRKLPAGIPKGPAEPAPRVLWPPLADDEGFDEIRIRKVPRYRTLASGECWTTSVRVSMVSKGRILLERDYRDIQAAVMFVPGLFLKAPQEEDFRRPSVEEDAGMCFQPGCPDPGVSTYRLKGPAADPRTERRRRFCGGHLRRGTAVPDDRDDDYEIVDGPGPGAPAREGGTKRTGDSA